MKVDYSEWLTPERLAVEEGLWSTSNSGNVSCAAGVACSLIEAHCLRTVVEFGCGPGHLASRLPPHVEYEGVDRNEWCLDLAGERLGELNRARFSLLHCDVREWIGRQRDLVIAHAFLKHFGLHEWTDIADIVFRAGRWAVFSMPISSRDHSYDDGVEFHHVHVPRSRLDEALKRSGKEVVAYTPDHPGPDASQDFGRCLFVAGPSQ